ncbi:MAG TPA: SigB/SigF/SigG family RNA polymerase sigma factor [Baekduia sp.]|nr:SigB/SigF/SigG family RNA polymerase sigma factor [Baekduia sp.]
MRTRALDRHRHREPGHEGTELRDRLLLRRYAQTRDPELRATLAERFLPMARHLALRVARGPEPLDDLVQVASIGLLKALDRYDPSRGTAFSSFAVPTIHGELQRYFRDRTWAVRPPRDLQELTLRMQRVSAELAARLDRSPTVAELADALGVQEADVLEAMQAAGSRSLPSLDAPVAGSDQQVALQDCIGRTDPALAVAEHRAELSRIQSVLTERERRIVRMRFQLDLTQRQIAERVGLSQMHVSRLLRQALEKLRQRSLAGAGPPEEEAAPASG